MADDETPAGDGHTPIRLAEHPRARQSISRAKAWGGVAGFGVSAWFGYHLGTPFVETALRSILIGAASALAVWGVSQAIWKQVIFAELAQRRREAVATQQAILAELNEHAARDDL